MEPSSVIHLSEGTKYTTSGNLHPLAQSKRPERIGLHPLQHAHRTRQETALLASETPCSPSWGGETARTAASACTSVKSTRASSATVQWREKREACTLAAKS